MKIINLDSRYDLSAAQVNFAQAVATACDDQSSDDNIASLMEAIPVFLLNESSMPGYEEQEQHSARPATEHLGFYQHDASLLNIRRPAIGICPERIIQQAANEEELMLLTAKVLAHEFAHAKMRLHPASSYGPVDTFYRWMEEPMANLLTLECFDQFRHGHRRGAGRPLAHVSTTQDPIDYVRDFIGGQPDNYRLALDLYDHRVRYWWIWRNQKEDFAKRTAEKQAWLDYVTKHVGNTEESQLQHLFEALHR